MSLFWDNEIPIFRIMNDLNLGYLAINPKGCEDDPLKQGIIDKDIHL